MSRRSLPGLYSACARAVSVAGFEVRLAAELHDALGDLVGVLLLLLRVFEELGLDRIGEHARRHEVMAVVAQHADPFGRQRFVEQAG